VAEAMSEAADSWYDNGPITDEQIDAIRSALTRTNTNGAAFGRWTLVKLLAKVDQLRAELAQLTPEYGVRTTYVSGTMSEQPVSDNAEDAHALIAEAEAKGRADVVSRELLVRGVEEWRKVAERA